MTEMAYWNATKKKVTEKDEEKENEVMWKMNIGARLKRLETSL